ncbi:MAG: enoyl-CoA hydratase/isomerase family protein [Desulfobacteraceae bacterium]|nr:enoyl-CoA hydratase/isomerase family protein [Desulfobacteraceae bacterium]
MVYENLIFKIEGNVATIVFDRPKALNALNSNLLDEFLQTMDEIEANEKIHVLLLTGSGEKSFIAGADITELATFNPLQAKKFSKKGQLIIQRLQELPIPVIAAVNGFALGGGSEMALACDFIYASDSATFGLPEITLGIIPGFGGTQRLSRLIGINKAKELIFTGKMIPASEAEKLGIVNKVFPAAELMGEAEKTARLIASKGRVSLRAAKEAVNNGINTDLATGLNIEVDAFAICVTSGDAKEGMNAFIEKRKAEFAGDLDR